MQHCIVFTLKKNISLFAEILEGDDHQCNFEAAPQHFRKFSLFLRFLIVPCCAEGHLDAVVGSLKLGSIEIIGKLHQNKSVSLRREQVDIIKSTPLVSHCSDTDVSFLEHI